MTIVKPSRFLAITAGSVVAARNLILELGVGKLDALVRFHLAGGNKLLTQINGALRRPGKLAK